MRREDATRESWGGPSLRADNGTVGRSPNGTDIAVPGKAHRVRLSDEEIKMIARALKHFYKLLDEKGLEDFQTRWKYRDLAFRFMDWGQERSYYDRPLYRRTRRPKE